MSAIRSFSRTLTTSARALNQPKKGGVLEQAGEALKSAGQAFKVGPGVSTFSAGLVCEVGRGRVEHRRGKTGLWIRMGMGEEGRGMEWYNIASLDLALSISSHIISHNLVVHRSLLSYNSYPRRGPTRALPCLALPCR